MEAFLLRDATKSDVPFGSQVSFGSNETVS